MCIHPPIYGAELGRPQLMKAKNKQNERVSHIDPITLERPRNIVCNKVESGCGYAEPGKYSKDKSQLF